MIAPLDKQIGGNHYNGLKIQPVEYIHANGIPYMEGNVIKYVTRWRDKGGFADLHKAKHYIELLLQLEAGYTPEAIEAARLPDWDAAEARMDAVGQNGPTGEHYQIDFWHEAPHDATHWDDMEGDWVKQADDEWYCYDRSKGEWSYFSAEDGYEADLIPRPRHVLLPHAERTPVWASRLHQPAGSRVIYAQNEDGRSEKVGTAPQTYDFDQTETI